MQFNSCHINFETGVSQTDVKFNCSTLYNTAIELICVKSFILGWEAHVHDIFYIYT